MKSFLMNSNCPGCGGQHSLIYKGSDTPSNMDQLQYICPKNNKTYRVIHRAIPVWVEEFEMPDGGVVAEKIAR